MRKTIVFVAGSVVFIIAIGSMLLLNARFRSHGIKELWQTEIDHHNLEGKIITVRGDAIFEPLSDFKFNALYLVDAQTPVDYRQPVDGFWFGIRIDDLACSIEESTWICEPFDPSQASAFEFRGKLHLDQVGKKEIMGLSDIDYAHSRQFVDGKWRPIPLGRFEIPLTGK